MLSQASHQDKIPTSLLQEQTTGHDHVWRILDTEAQWSGFSQKITTADNTALVESHFLLSGLRCAACAGIIEAGLQKLVGIEKVRVSMSKNRAVITWSPTETKPSSILQAIHDLGYEGNPASHLADQTVIAAKKRAAFWRWMVAGFCMMQVMMYSAPSYFASSGQISSDMYSLLNWASWLMSLPVLLFSSSTFFSNAFQDLKHQRISMDLPVALGILITFIVSSAATFDPSGLWGETVYFDTMTMLVFFLLSARFIEVRMHSKTMGALEALMNRIPESTLKLNVDGSFSRVLNKQLAINDIVKVNIGEAFPADGKIIEGETQVDESLLTGESTPINKHLDDNIVAGSYNLGQSVNVMVEGLGDATQYGKIVNLINQASIEKPRLSRLVDRLAKPFLLFVLMSAGLAAALLWNGDHGHALMTAAAVLIVTCPCAISLATPAAMLASASAFVKRGILIKNLQAIENIADIDTVIFDKTGTLTNDDIQVTHIKPERALTEAQVLSLAASLAKHSTHPISRAIVGKSQLAVLGHTEVALVAIKEQVGLGVQGQLNANNLLRKTIVGQIKLGSALFCETSVTDETSHQVYLADELGLLATFTLQEQLKPLAHETISTIKNNQYSVELISGDQAHTVNNIANTLGISHFLAACNPQDKLARLNVLKQKGKKVLMIGDGLNDGPILASAHVSIAMGKGVPLTHAHADYILLNGDISQIPTLIAQAKKTMQIIKQNISWAIIYNVICIPLAFFGMISAWQAGLGMALSSLFVVFNALRLSRFNAVNQLAGSQG